MVLNIEVTFLSLLNSLLSTLILVLFLWGKAMWFGRQNIGVVNSMSNLISRWPKSCPPPVLVLTWMCFTLRKVEIIHLMVIEFQQFGPKRPVTRHMFTLCLLLVETRTITNILNVNYINGTILRSNKRKIPMEKSFTASKLMAILFMRLLTLHHRDSKKSSSTKVTRGMNLLLPLVNWNIWKSSTRKRIIMPNLLGCIMCRVMN